MPHNPIIRQTKLGTSRPEIGRTQRGVLDDGRQYRELPPNLGRADLWAWRNQTLTVVDCSWHTWKWRASLPSRDAGPAGEWDIEIAYRVINALICVSRQVSDLESALRRALRPALEGVAGRYRLPEYERTAAALREAIRADGAWNQYGLEVDSEVRITPQLSEKHRKDIDEADALDAATRRPRAYVRSAQLRSADPTYTFDAIVYLSVLILRRDEFRSLADLDAAVEVLWNGKVRRALAGVSREYTYRQLAVADAALDQELQAGNFDGYGLTVVDASAELTLGATAAEAAREDEKLGREIDVDAKRQDHTRDMAARAQKEAFDAFRNRAATMALAVARGEMTVSAALASFDKKDLENYQWPIDMLERLKGIDALGPDEQDAAVRVILARSLSDSSGSASVPADVQISIQDMLRHLSGAGSPLALTDSAPDKGDNADEEDEDA